MAIRRGFLVQNGDQCPVAADDPHGLEQPDAAMLVNHGLDGLDHRFERRVGTTIWQRRNTSPEESQLAGSSVMILAMRGRVYKSSAFAARGSVGWWYSPSSNASNTAYA